MLVNSLIWSGVLYFLMWMSISAFWSGTAFTYSAESFPTKLRGIGVALADASQVAGYVLGAAFWTGLINHLPHEAVWASAPGSSTSARTTTPRTA